MTQRTTAHIGIWIMILAGILLAINLFVVPQFASIFAEMDTELPSIAIMIMDISNFMIQNGLFIAWLYSTLFIAIVVWYGITKVRTKNP